MEFRLGKDGVLLPVFVPGESLARPLRIGQLDLRLSVLFAVSVSRSGRGGVGKPSPKLTEKNALVLLGPVPALVFLVPVSVAEAPL